MSQKIAMDRVNGLSKEEFVERFGPLYEHSPWVAERAWRERPFGDLAELHGAFFRAVHDAPAERQLALIQAHPDLAGKAALAGELTLESSHEQASAGLDRLSPEEYENFRRMNREYRERFRFPMIVAVREHAGKETILADAAARLKHSRSEEIQTAISEISKIAYLRLQDLVKPDGDETMDGKAERTVERA